MIVVVGIKTVEAFSIGHWVLFAHAGFYIGIMIIAGYVSFHQGTKYTEEQAHRTIDALCIAMLVSNMIKCIIVQDFAGFVVNFILAFIVWFLYKR